MRESINIFAYPGRALRIGSRVALPEVSSEAAWLEQLNVRVESIDARDRERLGALWLADGLAEQASIATFGQLALHLIRFGAPPELIARCHQAALDEIIHARLCFSLASRYRGEPVTGSALPAASEIDRRVDLGTLLEQSIVDGAFSEGFSARVISRAAKQTAEQSVASILSRLGSDEARHAALGWDIATWALDRAPATMRLRLRSALDRIERLKLDEKPYPDGLAMHGRPDAIAAKLIFDSTRTELSERIRQTLALERCA